MRQWFRLAGDPHAPFGPMARSRAAGDDAASVCSDPPVRFRKPLAFQSLRTQESVPPGKYLDDFRQRLRVLAHQPISALDVGALFWRESNAHYEY